MLGFVWIGWNWATALLTAAVWFAASHLMAGGIYQADLTEIEEALGKKKEEHENDD